MKDKKILTIERRKWYRGKGSDESVLLNSRGEMCCLGFDAIANGLSQDCILGMETPAAVVITHRKALTDHPDYFANRVIDTRRLDQSPEVLKAIQHNDNPHITEPDRERFIREDLIALGWDDVVFV
jgi:hypothetical protein